MLRWTLISLLEPKISSQLSLSEQLVFILLNTAQNFVYKSYGWQSLVLGSFVPQTLKTLSVFGHHRTLDYKILNFGSNPTSKPTENGAIILVQRGEKRERGSAALRGSITKTNLTTMFKFNASSGRQAAVISPRAKYAPMQLHMHNNIPSDWLCKRQWTKTWDWRMKTERTVDTYVCS